MKKRDIFWLNRVLLILITGLFFVGISLYNIVQFNNSYIKEETDEIDIFKKQIEWVITPFLKKKDFKSIQKYTSDFKDNEDFYFQIFDKDKKLIASSLSNTNSKIGEDDSRTYKLLNIWDLYLHSFHDKRLEKISEINVNDTKYYVEISLSQEYVISSIIKGQKNIIAFFCVCIAILIGSLIHIFYNIRHTFNKLEDSVIKIANGELDTEIELPKIALLSELTSAIKKMTLRLKKQIQRLTQLDNYRKDFISNISHEIKTPLTAINSAVELLDDNEKLSQTNRECLNIISFQTKYMNKLINDILNLSEIDLEKTNTKKEFNNYSLNDIINDAINIQGICDVNICFNPDKDYNAFCDKELLTTAFSNIINNSIKYSQSDKIDIVLTDTSIEFIDYGIGIPEEHVPRIFERFYRVDKARSRKSGGTGLGLAIVKNIIELHNWEIEIISHVNNGTIIKIARLS